MKKSTDLGFIVDLLMIAAFYLRLFAFICGLDFAFENGMWTRPDSMAYHSALEIIPLNAIVSA